MRNEYLALQEVGGLTVNNSILNQANIAQQINEIKEHQDHVALNLKNELADNIMKSLKALNMGNKNISPSFHPYGLGPAQQYHSYMNSDPPLDMYQQHQQMNLMPQNDDPVLQQLLSQFSSMQ